MRVLVVNEHNIDNNLLKDIQDKIVWTRSKKEPIVPGPKAVPDTQIKWIIKRELAFDINDPTSTFLMLKCKSYWIEEA